MTKKELSSVRPLLCDRCLGEDLRVDANYRMYCHDCECRMGDESSRCSSHMNHLRVFFLMLLLGPLWLLVLLLVGVWI
jgi:hypothetical protein